ncbi:hypothetical protein KBX39_30165, partial [Micromonospora sp. D75]|nr:hypothetical protein [Micromonospora sp. D75]
MSSTKLVPETRLMTENELSADDAWHTLRRHGGWCLLRDAFVRFRWSPLRDADHAAAEWFNG